MEFGILFNSHPGKEREPYPHRAVHARVTNEIIAADRLGYDIAGIAERHFSNGDGNPPDPFSCIAYLAPRTERIKPGAAVMTPPSFRAQADSTAYYRAEMKKALRSLGMFAGEVMPAFRGAEMAA